MDKVKSSIKKNTKVSNCAGGCPPYGYKRDSEYGDHFIIDEAAAKVVRRVFQMVIEGHGIYGICSILTKEGIPTPSQYRDAKSKETGKFSKKRIHGKTAAGIWSMSTLRRILHNQVYLGHTVQYNLGKSHNVNTDPGLWPVQKVVKKNTQESIVDEHTFSHVQNLLHRKGRMLDEVRGCNHILSGKVRCKDCKSPMYKSSTRNKKGVYYHYLRCVLASKTRGKECTPHRVRYDMVLDYLGDKIWEKICLSTDDTLVEEWKEVVEMERRQVEEYQTLLQDKVKELNKNFVTLYLDRVKGILSEEEFYRLKKSIEREKLDLDKELCRLKKNVSKNEENVLLVEKMKVTRGLLCRFVEYIEIGEKEGKSTEIIIHWKQQIK